MLTEKPIRIGYFHGGRTQLLYRVFQDFEWQRAGLEVAMYSRDLYAVPYELMPRSINIFNAPGTHIVGKVRGTELISDLLDGQFDITTPGESSFIEMLGRGMNVVSIAELGHDTRAHSGHVFMVRNGLKTDKREDFLGRVLASRRAGPGDSIMLKEFLKTRGVDVKKDILQLETVPVNLAAKDKLPKDKVLVADQVMEDLWKRARANGVMDGGYFHLMNARKQPLFRRVSPLQEWADPELSHALLVATPEYVAEHRAELVRFLEVYIKRIQYEHSLSYEVRTKPGPKGIQMAMDIDGLNLPQYDIDPTTSVELLTEVHSLLKEYGFLPEKDIDIPGHVDNSLVLEAMKNLGLTEADDYWASEF